MNGSVQIELQVDATRHRQGIVAVNSHYLFPRCDRIVLRVPKWLPAFHAPRGPLKFMAGFEFSGDGEPLRWTRDPGDPFRFVIEFEGERTSLQSTHQFLSPTDSKQGRVLMGENMLRLQWAGLCLYPETCDLDQIEVVPHVVYPPGWRAVSALTVLNNQDGQISYAPCRLIELIDSPILAGAHHHLTQLADGIDLAIFADDPEQLPSVREHIDLHAALIAEADAVFQRRPFRRYTFLLSLSDQLGRMGLEHRSSSECGVAGDYFTQWQRSVTDHDLLPHEYVHSWIGKYRVPSGNQTRDFGKRMTNELLWVYEGLTQYYGHVLAARCGLISHELTLGAFALAAATYDERPGRRWRPLADTVHDPIMAAREALPWTSWQRSEDYYSEGMLVWLEADMTIRKLSGNARSLDDFVKWFFSPSSPTEPACGYDHGDLMAALYQVQPFDWEQFFAARIEEIARDAPLDGLQLGGFRLGWSDTPNTWHRCDQLHHSYCDLRFSIGLKMGLANRILEVIWNSPAFAAELTVGATILKIGEIDYSHETMLEALSDGPENSTPINLVVRQHGIEREVEIPRGGGLRYPVLEELEGKRLLSDALLSCRKDSSSASFQTRAR